MQKRFVWDPENKNMTEMPPKESAETPSTYSLTDFRAAVEAEADRITAQLSTKADFEAAVAAEVERRLATMPEPAQEDVKILRPATEESAVKMGVAPEKKEGTVK